jgi:hypothetical protein
MENRKYCLETVPEVSSGNPKTKINPVNRSPLKKQLRKIFHEFERSSI